MSIEKLLMLSLILLTSCSGKLPRDFPDVNLCILSSRDNKVVCKTVRSKKRSTISIRQAEGFLMTSPDDFQDVRLYLEDKAKRHCDLEN